MCPITFRRISPTLALQFGLKPRAPQTRLQAALRRYVPHVDESIWWHYVAHGGNDDTNRYSITSINIRNYLGTWSWFHPGNWTSSPFLVQYSSILTIIFFWVTSWWPRVWIKIRTTENRFDLQNKNHRRKTRNYMFTFYFWRLLIPKTMAISGTYIGGAYHIYEA